MPLHPPSPPPISPPPPDEAARAREARALTPKIDRETPAVELRLAIGKDGLGIELGRPATLGCVEVTDIAVSLPGVRFPLDVSGGVSRFRHRRGELTRLGFEVGARALEKWAAHRLRGIVSTETPEVWVFVRRDAATVGVGSKAPDGPVLAFEVTLDAEEDDLRLTVCGARGLGLPAPATALAIDALGALLKGRGTREGARFVLPHVAATIARTLLPEAGARAPSCEEIRFTMTSAAGDAWILHASRGAPAEVREEATRARESAALTRDADDARVAGDLVRARALDLAALERAPRHPAIAARLAEIDALVGGRAEAALGTLREADTDPRAPRLTTEAELLVEAGDVAGAVAAFARIGDTEAVPALAARAYASAAALTADPHDALPWLDLALARAPGAAGVRWARATRRLAAGRIAEAEGDVEHLEAGAVGARAKHAVWTRAGAAWRSAGLVGESARIFERALRYAPDDASALAGLGAALVEGTGGPKVGRSAAAERRAARGTALLARAIELAEARGEDANAMTVDLARALGDVLGDRPAAIARVRGVSNSAREATVARGLEARWRAALGDSAGAALAWARVRDLATSRFDQGDTSEAEQAAGLLREAAAFERDVRGDLPAAQRHLAAALRLTPRDVDLGRAYRDVCAKITPHVSSTPEAAPLPEARRAPALDTIVATPLSEDDEANAALRVEDLTRQLQGDPTRDDVVDELAALLTRLGRGLELLALLSARLEDAPPERRAALLPQQRTVLQRLEEAAEAAGRTSEASLFRDARKMLG